MNDNPQLPARHHAAVKTGLRECLETAADEVRLALTLPDAQALDGLVAALARLMAVGQRAP